ncbi:hypothetical protein ICT70_09600 [Pelobacter sp. M08fum]|uniref:Uncharacterized protein n=1 Tax=Pelovirga terrestris TaxID=2771352 RepID=A0A8J6QXP5_9BACT|nr:hypothetical protein [Pelovirga terrestris]
MAAETGNRHETEQCRDQQIEQIVAGIDRSKPEKQGQGKIKSTGTG